MFFCEADVLMEKRSDNVTYLHRCDMCGNGYDESELKSFQTPKSLHENGFVMICGYWDKCIRYRKFLQGSTIKLIYEEEANV